MFNLNCKNTEIPAYNQIIFNNQSYTIINPPNNLESKSNDKTYQNFDVLVSGTVLSQKGHMPNPMVETLTIYIDDLEFI